MKSPLRRIKEVKRDTPPLKSLARGITALCLSFLLLGAAIRSDAAAADYAVQVLHSFRSPDGLNPVGGLVRRSDGTLWGTTQNGAAYGTVFQIATDGRLSVIVSFDGANGLYPLTGLLKASDGTLYGTTSEGGPGNGFGTVFKITPEGNFETIFTFADSNGHRPEGDLIFGSDGCIYGTTFYGGAGADGASYSNGGTVFKISPQGIFRTLFSFTGTNGYSPAGRLLEAKDGNLYGTTVFGGDHDFGTVFKITPIGDIAVIWQFSGEDGRNPATGLIQGEDGTLYGTTDRGGTSDLGTVFKITTNGILSSLASFNGQNGEYPEGELAQDAEGKFYGTTLLGGESGSGTIFEVTSEGTLRTIISFDGTNGLAPYAGLTLDVIDGNFYGTTASGGGSGTVFRLVHPTAISSISVANGAVALTLNSFFGGVYQIQSRAELSETNWTVSRERVVATANTTNTTYVDLLSAAGSQFYRVALLPW